VTADSDDVKVSFFRRVRPEGVHILAVITNFAEDATTVKLKVTEAAIATIGNAADALTGEPLDVSGYTVTIPVLGLRMRMVELK